MGIRKFLSDLFAPKVPELTRNSGYGWKPDFPDHRDIRCTLTDSILEESLPVKVDLRTSGLMPYVYDQGQLGSCTANAIAGALEFDRAKQGLPVWTPSRLFIYYYERLMEGTVSTDSGAMIRDGFKVINTTGYAKESDWPYVIQKFAVKPSAQAQADAATYKAVKYQHVDQTAHAIRGILSHGLPICFGISVYASFESQNVARTGIVPMPSQHESLLGGHAILIVGYDDTKKLYTFRNSWGTSWGDGGYGYLPYDYVHNPKLASDFWIVQTLND